MFSELLRKILARANVQALPGSKGFPELAAPIKKANKWAGKKSPLDEKFNFAPFDAKKIFDEATGTGFNKYDNPFGKSGFKPPNTGKIDVDLDEEMGGWEKLKDKLKKLTPAQKKAIIGAGAGVGAGTGLGIYLNSDDEH